MAKITAFVSGANYQSRFCYFAANYASLFHFGVYFGANYTPSPPSLARDANSVCRGWMSSRRRRTVIIIRPATFPRSRSPRNGVLMNPFRDRVGITRNVSILMDRPGHQNPSRINLAGRADRVHIPKDVRAYCYYPRQNRDPPLPRTPCPSIIFRFRAHPRT